MSEQKQGFAQYGLDERILQALHLLGMDVPTSIQQQVLPQVLQKRDIIAQAQTGSGKTAAFAVPLCQLVDWEENKPQVMILTPTRELAMQVQQEILQKLSSETDQTVRQSMLVSIIEQLPMRMTRKRFFQVLAEGMDAYKGSDKEAVDGQLFMLRTAAMLEEPAEFKQSFPAFYEVVETFKQAPLSTVSEAEWNKLHDMLADAMEELNSQMDRMLLLQELINDLCVVTMTDGCTWTEQHKTCSSIISFTLTPGTDEAALNAMLTALEGIQEQYSMTFQEKSTLVDELMQSSKEQLSEQGMIETFSKLEVLSKLLSSSRFADIEQKQESETVEASYIEEQTAALISELETFLKSSSKPLARAVMAKLVTMVPLFIRDYNQLEEYIQNSLSSCSDVAEKLACIEIIRSL